MRIVTLFLSAALCATAWAGKISLGVIPTITMTTQSQQPNVKKSNMQVSGGAHYEHTLSETLGLEIGVVYLQRHVRFPASSTDDSNLRIKSFHFPLVARYWMNEWLGLSAGVFLNTISDKADTWQNDNDDLTVEGTLTNFAKTDFGAVVGVRANPAFSDSLGLVIDARYNLSFTDVDETAAGELKLSFLTFLVGVSYNLGE